MSVSDILTYNSLVCVYFHTDMSIFNMCINGKVTNVLYFKINVQKLIKLIWPHYQKDIKKYNFYMIQINLAACLFFQSK